MMKWLKRKTEAVPHSPPHHSASDTQASEQHGFFTRLKHSLTKTRTQVGQGLRRLFVGKTVIDSELLEDLETQLLMADFGVETTALLLKQLQEDVATQQLSEGEMILAALQKRMIALFQPLVKTDVTGPRVILMVGVNGAGKTTTIGKLAHRYQQEGLRVMLAAGDTFRAAAVEQLQAWGQRNDVAVIAQHTGADSASVLYDAFQAAKARGMDVLIADTAGRLHTQSHLMEELKKVKRVIQKLDAQAPHDVLLVLDASIGQNALNQARQFHEAIGLTGIVMTKLDGTAKGGIVFSIAHHIGVPLVYLGMGEGIDDLRPFDAEEFVQAIFQDD
jgi:fused signal recognition particle receptor